MSVISTIKQFRTEFFVNYAGWKRVTDYSMTGEDNFAFATADGMPSWFTLNASVSYSITKDISLQIACENILNQNYRQYASNISAPGRNFILTLRGSFKFNCLLSMFFRQLVNMMINTDGDFFSSSLCQSRSRKNEQPARILSYNFDK